MILAKASKKTKTKINRIYQTPLLVMLVVFFILSPLNFSQAKTFNPHNILTDPELFDKNALSKTAIQKFLERKNSVLARYSQVVEGRILKASEMIWEIGQKHDINPEFLLATLEKEQGLIRKSQATEKALDWATGYGCYGGSCKEKYRGFYNQVEATAETQQIYHQRANEFGFRIGVTTISFDGYKVTPQNQATANLYIYTPYVGYSPELGITAPYGGNRLFWRIWQRYFTNQKFLDGQIVKFNGNYWLIENNQKRKFLSQEIFAADHQPDEAIEISSKDLAAYPDGPSVNFSNNTLVKSASSGQIFLLAENKKRPIIDNAALALLSDFHITALTETDIPVVSESQLAAYTLGSLISTSSIYPQGELFKDQTGQIWLIQDGLKHEVDPLVWQNRFDSKIPLSVTNDALEQYPTGEPTKLKDGTFVLANNNYYVISNSERVKIESPEIFNTVFGLSKKNSALNISTALLEIHTAGETVDYIDDTILDPPTTTVSPSQTSSIGNYAATFDSMDPDGLIMIAGSKVSVTLKFKNTGRTSWQQGNVWLALNDKDSQTSSFNSPEKINFSENSVSKDQVATFDFELTAPTAKTGLLNEEFSLYYSQNGASQKITSIGKFIIVKPGLAAEILEHNIPIAVRNTWRPIEITMKIKNLSPDTTWLSKRTALEIYNLDGTTSYFYDPNDWVREEVAAVPINDSYIEPGEVGEFKFTLDPRNIKPNAYYLNFQLKLLDKDKQVYLDGDLEWHRLIRVD